MILSLNILIDAKSKVREILKDQSDNLRDFSNCYLFLFGEYFENYFSKFVKEKQKSKSLFTGWMLEKLIWVKDEVLVAQIRGAHFHIMQGASENSLSQVHSSNVVVNPKTSNKAGAVERLPEGISKDSKYIFRENYSRCAFGGETKTFPRQLAKISANTNFLGYFRGSKISLSNTPSRNCCPPPVKMKENEKSIALKERKEMLRKEATVQV